MDTLIRASDYAERRNANLRRGNLKHGHGRRNNTSPEYNSYRAAWRRCFYPKLSSYHHYGGRGITMCDHWKTDFLRFLADMGPRPKGMFLERVDNDKGYLCPLCVPPNGNCCWATRSQQAKNQRVEFRQQRSERMSLWWARQTEEYRQDRVRKLSLAKASKKRPEISENSSNIV